MVASKICGLKTPETVAAAVENGAEFVGFNFFANIFPIFTKRRIGKHVVKLLAGQHVAAESILAFDVFRVFTLHQHIGLGDGVGFFIDLLAVEINIKVWIDSAKKMFFADSKHASCAAGWIVKGNEFFF